MQNRPVMPTAENAQFSWYSPVGLLTPASWAAMFARRYMHATGATSEALGWVALADRRHAATNPKAWFYEKPITMDDYMNSRWIVEPLRLLDCCQETDGGQAVVVTSLERARDLANPPAVVRAVAQGSWHGQDMMTSYYRDDMSQLPEMGLVARQLYENAGIGPTDMQTAVLYDAFTPFVLYTIEEFGFCGWGEAKDFVADGNIEIGGGLPDQHPWWPAGGGLPPRGERDRRGGAPGARHLGQPGGRGRARGSDGRHRRAHQRHDSGHRPLAAPSVRAVGPRRRPGSPAPVSRRRAPGGARR